MTKEQTAMERYLEKKYGQEFVVDKPKYTNSGFGVDGIWVTTAHPKDDPSLVFDMDGVKDLSKIYDQYIAALWSKEQTQVIRPDVMKLYGKDANKVKVAVRIVFSGDIAQDTTLAASGYEEAKAKYADRGLYYEYNITNVLGMENTSGEADRVYRLIDIARGRGLKMIGVRYTDNKDGDKLVCSMGYSKVALATDASVVKNCLDNMVKVEE